MKGCKALKILLIQTDKTTLKKGVVMFSEVNWYFINDMIDFSHFSWTLQIILNINRLGHILRELYDEPLYWIPHSSQIMTEMD